MRMSRSKVFFNVDLTVRGFIDGFVKKIQSVPVLNIFGGIVGDYQYLWENYYFSSTASLRTPLLMLAASM